MTQQKQLFLKRRVYDFLPYFALTCAFLQPGALLCQKPTMRNIFLKIQQVIPLCVDTPHRQKQRFLKRRVDDFLYDFGPMCIFPLLDEVLGAKVSSETQISENYIGDFPIRWHAASTETMISETPGRRFPLLL